MSNKDYAKSLIDLIPDAKMVYIISYLQGAAIPEEIPNAETLEAIAEVEGMVKAGAGEHFTGSTEDFLASLLED